MRWFGMIAGIEMMMDFFVVVFSSSCRPCCDNGAGD